MRIYPFFLAHAGCPHRCSYCNQQTRATSHPPTPATVVTWLEENLPADGDGHCEGVGDAEVAFYGGTFTLLDLALQQSYCDAVLPFVRAGRVSGVRVSTRPDAMNVETAQRLRATGVTTVELGCQSFEPEVLNRCGRDYDATTIAAAVTALHSVGMTVGLQLMPGLPGADAAEALGSLRQALALNPDFVRIYPTLVLAGTRLAEEYKNGEYQPWSLDQMVDVCADMFRLCQEAEVPIIRMGLQSTSELDTGDLLLAGPYHPAFGQLVRSRLWRRALNNLLVVGKRLVRIHRDDLSDALGQKKENMRFLTERFGEFKLVAEPHIARGHLLCDDDSFRLLTLAA